MLPRSLIENGPLSSSGSAATVVHSIDRAVRLTFSRWQQYSSGVHSFWLTT